MPSPHRGRFAPSPTGPLHLGNAWAALLGWLWAHSEGGEFVLRIEDLDASRCRPEFLDALQRDLEWLGLTFDGPVVFQSQRAEHYAAALGRLAAEGRVYACFCTRAEVMRAASAPHGAADDGPVYPRTCARLDRAEVLARSRTRTAALRFRAAPGRVQFVDAVAGPSQQDVEATAGDFVVRRNDGVASYQLAVVVDDADAGVTHVLRGDDLLGSTPRQIQLAQALGLPVPRYAHVPLLVGPDGKRLAKRAGPPTLSELREARLPKERLLGLLAGWAGLSEGHPVSAEALVERFSLARLGPSPRAVDAGGVRAALERLL
ncbi:MAG: tRNA glutamyl-Q(34) synthetase GluQRS [Myxococcaceae bacterium]